MAKNTGKSESINSPASSTATMTGAPPAPQPPPAAAATPKALQPNPLGRDVDSIKQGVLEHLQFTLAELPKHVDTEWEPYVALSLAVRDRMVEKWIRTHDAYYEQDAKRVYYLSLEFL